MYKPEREQYYKKATEHIQHTDRRRTTTAYKQF